MARVERRTAVAVHGGRLHRFRDPGPDTLVERARKGDVGAFERLVAQHDRGLRALAYRVLGDRDAMDDVLQETYLRCFRNLDGFRGEAALRSWLYRIAYNLCLDELRRERGGRDQVPLDSVLDGDQAAACFRDSADTRLDLEAAMALLAPVDRAAVVLVCVEGFDYATGAEILGVPPGTLASRLHRARATLRAALAEAPGGGVDP